MPQSLVDLYQELEMFILTDISRRLAKAGTITSTAEWQQQQAQLFGINNINQKVTEILKQSNKEIEKMFGEAALTTISSENETFKKAGYKGIELNKSKALQDYLKTAIKHTKGDIENITQSMGFAEKSPGGKIVYNSTAKFYQKEINLAHSKVVTGVADYNTAIKQAVNKISQSGLRYVDYESGYSNNLDVAVRRAVVSSAHSMNNEMTNYNMNKLIPPDEQYAEVSAHSNCRPTHQSWQGQVYKVNGSNEEYDNLAEVTDLGDVGGLCGANCHHSYYVFIPGVSERAYTDEQLKNINTPDFEYNGKTYTGYEATQYQRKLETAMRESKRKLLCYKETGLNDDFKIESSKLQNLKREYKNFSSTADLKQQLERTQVSGFGKSISQQAVNATK